MANNRRSITDVLPRLALVTPEGHIKMVDYANNVTGAVEVVDGLPVVSRGHERLGWRILEDLYREDGRADLYAVWEQHQTALLKARGRGGTIPPFPAEFLPTEVQRRRAGQRPNVITWKMPANLKPVSMPSAEPAEPAERPAEKRPGK